MIDFLILLFTNIQ